MNWRDQATIYTVRSQSLDTPDVGTIFYVMVTPLTKLGVCQICETNLQNTGPPSPHVVV